MAGDWLDQLRLRSTEDWLLGLVHPEQLVELAETRVQDFSQRVSEGQRSTVLPTVLPTILLMESEPTYFLASFMAACAVGCPIFLGNPQWTKAEYEQVRSQISGSSKRRAIVCAQSEVWLEPEQSFASSHDSLPDASPDAPDSIANCIMIPTGGTSGRMRFAIHTSETLAASVTGFQEYFQRSAVHSCCVLPLYHVSGLMQFLRSFLSGGQFACFRTLAAAAVAIDSRQFFLSLVPTQLARSLQSQDQAMLDWLAQFHTILLGGAPAWDDLLQTARQQQLRLAPTYGMTETASQIATLKPEDFLAGQTGCGRVLPHAEVVIRDQQGQRLTGTAVGSIAIQGRSIALGYYPDRFTSPEFATDDLGYLDQAGYLHIVGRRSQKIITGGENVFPSEVEAVIRSSGWVQDVCVLGLPDADWGEVVTAVYVPMVHGSLPALQEFLSDRLSQFKCPKRWLELTALPRNAQGKVNLLQLKHLISHAGDRCKSR